MAGAAQRITSMESVLVVRIPTKTHDQLRALAKHEGEHMSVIVRRALRQYLGDLDPFPVSQEHADD
jgi:predicted DNA-binding protein